MLLLAAFIAVSSSTVVVERIGTITQLKCAAKECEGLDELVIQPTFDWEQLEKADARSKKALEKPGVDQHGGLWYFSLPAKARPAFAGYLVDGEKVEVAEVAPPPKKKKGLKALLGDD